MPAQLCSACLATCSDIPAGAFQVQGPPALLCTALLGAVLLQAHGPPAYVILAGRKATWLRRPRPSCAPPTLPGRRWSRCTRERWGTWPRRSRRWRTLAWATQSRSRKRRPSRRCRGTQRPCPWSSVASSPRVSAQLQGWLRLQVGCDACGAEPGAPDRRVRSARWICRPGCSRHPRGCSASPATAPPPHRRCSRC